VCRGPGRREGVHPADRQPDIAEEVPIHGEVLHLVVGLAPQRRGEEGVDAPCRGPGERFETGAATALRVLLEAVGADQAMTVQFTAAS